MQPRPMVPAMTNTLPYHQSGASLYCCISRWWGSILASSSSVGSGFFHSFQNIHVSNFRSSFRLDGAMKDHALLRSSQLYRIKCVMVAVMARFCVKTYEANVEDL